MTFKDGHPEFQHLCRELVLLTDHNEHALRTGLTIRLYSWLTLSFATLERFLRIVEGVEDVDELTLAPLLERVTSKKRGLIRFASQDERQSTLEFVRTARNYLMHGKHRPTERENIHLLAFARDLARWIDRLIATVDVTSATRTEQVVPFEPRQIVSQPQPILGPAAELEALRSYNLPLEEGRADVHGLLLAEGTLVATLIESAFRSKLNAPIPDNAGFATVLAHTALTVPGVPIEAATADLCMLKNCIAHSSYERRVHRLGAASLRDYFKRYYASEIECLYQVFEDLQRQLGPDRLR